MRSNRVKILAWILSFLIAGLPFSSLAFAIEISPAQDSGKMPCHQKTDVMDHTACPETGLAACECCEYAAPVVLTFDGLSVDKILFVSSIYQEKLLVSVISQPQLPPFRPPRFSI